MNKKTERLAQGLIGPLIIIAGIHIIIIINKVAANLFS